MGWKLRKAEVDVERLLQRASAIDAEIVRRFPRSIRDILCASLPVSFECHARLTTRKVVEVLGDLYDVDHRELLSDGDGALAGYTFARGEIAVVFAESQYGEGFERFTLAHEAAHIAVEYLPMLARSRQAELFGGERPPAFYARRDPPGHLFVGDVAGPDAKRGDVDYARLQSDRKAWLREVVANACAAELLAPHREVSRLLASLDAHADQRAAIQDHFGLSRQAADVRLREVQPDLGAQGALSFLLD
jgi:hypothetical protein